MTDWEPSRRGKIADVVVVEGNPLDDLDALEHVGAAFVAGKRLV